MKTSLSRYTVSVVLIGLCIAVLYGEEAKEPIYKGKPLKAWVAALDGQSKESRIEAIKALGKIGSRAQAAVFKLSEILKNKCEPTVHRLGFTDSTSFRFLRAEPTAHRLGSCRSLRAFPPFQWLLCRAKG